MSLNIPRRPRSGSASVCYSYILSVIPIFTDIAVEVYLNLVAAAKLTRDVQLRNIPFDERWTESNLPEYFHEIANIPALRKYAPVFDDFFLGDGFLGGRAKKEKKSAIYNATDKDAFGVDELPPGYN